MIEAMLSGTPVLAFGRGSVPEIVEEGVTGFVCRDADEMAARLRAIARLRSRRLPAARARALDDGAHGARLHRLCTRPLQAWVGDVRAAETVA